MSLIVNKLSSSLLPEISFNASPGQCLCLAGPSGVGKTLLLRAIADLDPNQGDIQLENKARESFSPDSWRKKVTYVPAESFWWSDLVSDHFTDSNPPLEKLGLNPDSLNWTTSRLSSGEKQRLSILRAMDHDPKVLLLDEATANLDNTNRDAVESLVRELLGQDKIIIWVSHDKQQRQRMANKSFILSREGLQEEKA